MSIVLAIDTSSEYLSLALQYPNGTDFCITKVGNSHSDLIINEIGQLLTKHSIKACEIDRIMYIEGPGSFTGLRIGLSVALGISYVAQALLVPVPSFMLYACQVVNMIDAQYVTVGIDARLNEIYLATINLKDMCYINEPTLVRPDEIRYIENTKYIGSGFSVYQEQIDCQVLEHVIMLSNYPNALNMFYFINKIKPVQPRDAALNYIRNKVALNLVEQANNK